MDRPARGPHAEALRTSGQSKAPSAYFETRSPARAWKTNEVPMARRPTRTRSVFGFPKARAAAVNGPTRRGATSVRASAIKNQSAASGALAAAAARAVSVRPPASTTDALQPFTIP